MEDDERTQLLKPHSEEFTPVDVHSHVAAVSISQHLIIPSKLTLPSLSCIDPSS